MKHNGIDGERPREQRSLDWEELVNLFKGTGQWNSALGPSPGQAGCLAPAHILRAYRCMESSMEPTKPGAPISRNVPSGSYEITKKLPERGGEFEYRIKSMNEPHERVVRESELQGE
jgi:hypothetical protein